MFVRQDFGRAEPFPIDGALDVGRPGTTGATGRPLRVARKSSPVRRQDRTRPTPFPLRPAVAGRVSRLFRAPEAPWPIRGARRSGHNGVATVLMRKPCASVCVGRCPASGGRIPGLRQPQVT